MGTFTLDIRGQLNSMKLSETRALWPLFEAVVNSIQSIEDSANKGHGKITIFACREEQVQTDLSRSELLGRFESFTISDNGIGFNSLNYTSFNTAYSTFKIKKGCKGIGRFLWLKAFESVDIESNYIESGTSHLRNFKFSVDGISPDENVNVSESAEQKTIVKLNGFLREYQEKSPVELDVVAKKIIEHCLPFFISNECPEIIISDGISDNVNLNSYFKTNIKDSLHQDCFDIKDEHFTLYHLLVPEGATKHELHFCANMQEVSSVDLSRHIPELQKKIYPADNPMGFYYVGYLSSSYLDSVVNTTRTDFEFDETNNQISWTGTGKESLSGISMDLIKSYLSDYLCEIKKKKREQIDNFVSESRPQYRYLLGKRPDVYDRIPAGLKSQSLELELHKEMQAWETEVKMQGQKLEVSVKNMASQDIAFHELFEKYCSGITEISKTCLAEYVARRKTLLDMLEQTLTIQEDGKFKKEEAIHSIICPMRHTSSEVPFEEMNLWMIDERLAYHRFLASDKPLRSLPFIDSRSKKELDIAVFDQALAFSDDDAPLNTVTIIEFKKPDNKQDNPLSQMGKYIDEIRAGDKMRASGLSFIVSPNTTFRCFAICDLTPQMKTHCRDAGLELSPDGMGYYGYNAARGSYNEVISYNKLLSDSKKRNQILFDKLFSPRLTEVVHVPLSAESQ